MKRTGEGVGAIFPAAARTVGNRARRECPGLSSEKGAAGMCEHGREERVEFLEWDAEPGDFCEWQDEDEEEEEEEEEAIPGSLSDEDVEDLLYSCPEPPVCVVVETFVSEHLCDYHVKNNPELEPDALAFAEEAGLGSSELLPIREGKETCEFVDVFGEGEECSRKADWAFILTTEYLLCEEHAAERKAGG